MYHCHIHFYFIGRPCRVFEMIKEMPPLENFSHEFGESRRPEGAWTAKADVIVADLQDMDVKQGVRALIAGKRSEVPLILLADQSQMALLADDLPKISDIWVYPMSDQEIRFRFLRWQQNYKMSKDFWQTNHFLEATINNSPNLIWYKDKNGIHEKVNDSFCRTVNKTKKQVEGRGHAYIWDVEYDDPVCIESEREVMEKKKNLCL